MILRLAGSLDDDQPAVPRSATSASSHRDELLAAAPALGPGRHGHPVEVVGALGERGRAPGHVAGRTPPVAFDDDDVVVALARACREDIDELLRDGDLGRRENVRRPDEPSTGGLSGADIGRIMGRTSFAGVSEQDPPERREYPDRRP